MAEANVGVVFCWVLATVTLAETGQSVLIVNAGRPAIGAACECHALGRKLFGVIIRGLSIIFSPYCYGLRCLRGEIDLHCSECCLYVGKQERQFWS